MDQEVDKSFEDLFKEPKENQKSSEIKFDLFEKIFLCIEQVKSSYQNSDDIKVMSNAVDNIIRSDLSFFYKIYSKYRRSKSIPTFIEYCIKYFNDIKLYHYTSMEALYSITESNYLLLSNIQDMNDSLECKLFFDILKRDFRKNHNLKEDKIKAVTEQFNKKLNDVFVFSFSAEDDDAAQWERYADNGEGVCLVTSIPNILRWLNLNKIHPNLLYPVEYIDRAEELENIISHEILDYSDYFRSISKLKNDHSDFVPNLCLNRMMVDCYKIKERSFRNEKEFRIIVYKDPIQNQRCNYSKRFIFNKSTFVRTKLEFSNVFLPTIDRQEHCNHCLFTEVILGLKSKADPKVIQDYLRNERGLDVTVSKSNSSLR